MAFERAIAVPTTFFGAYTPRERPSKPPPRAHAARDDSPLTPPPMSIRTPPSAPSPASGRASDAPQGVDPVETRVFKRFLAFGSPLQSPHDRAHGNVTSCARHDRPIGPARKTSGQGGRPRCLFQRVIRATRARQVCPPAEASSLRQRFARFPEATGVRDSSRPRNKCHTCHTHPAPVSRTVWSCQEGGSAPARRQITTYRL